MVQLERLLVLDVSPGKKWFYVLSQGIMGLSGLLISLFLLADFWQFTVPKLVAWLIPLGMWAITLIALGKNQHWRYRRGFFLPHFVPQSGNRIHWRYSLLAIAYWLLIWLLLWRETAWLGAWQYVSTEWLLQAFSAAKASPGYYQMSTGECLGLSSVSQSPDSK